MAKRSNDFAFNPDDSEWTMDLTDDELLTAYPVG